MRRAPIDTQALPMLHPPPPDPNKLQHRVVKRDSIHDDIGICGSHRQTIRRTSSDDDLTGFLPIQGLLFHQRRCQLVKRRAHCGPNSEKKYSIFYLKSPNFRISQFIVQNPKKKL